MKKRFTNLALFLAIMSLCIAVVSGCAVIPSGVVGEDDPAENELSENELSEKRLAAVSLLEKLEKKDDPTRKFPYLENVVSGEADPNAPKLDLDTVKEIISDCGEFSAILEKIDSIQPYPDCVYGSGLTLVEYWFDETGDEKLFIVYEQGQMYYDFLDSEGKVKTEVLLDPHA